MILAHQPGRDTASFLLFLTLVLTHQPSASVDPSQAPPPEARIEWSELPPDLPRSLRDSVRFGYLPVPADHANPSGPRIRIAIAVLPARSTTKAPDPIVLIPGGPGLGAIEPLAASVAVSKQYDLYRQRRDLILMDPRGHGFSDPPTYKEGLSGFEPLPGGSAAAERRWLAKLAECRTRLLADGVRLETLSAVQVAHDLEWLRQALAVPRLNLYGASYGTRIAAEAMRQVPSTIRAVHFSGPVPAGRYRGENESEVADEALAALFRRCAEQAQCRAAYPNLKADFDTIIRRAHAAPAYITLPPSANGPGDQIIIDEALVRVGLSQLLETRALAAGVPLLIHTLAEDSSQGERMTRHFMQPLGGDARGSAGTHLAFWCNDGVITRASAQHLQQRCRTWLGNAWGGDEAEPVRSDIPAVITSGEMDPRTPPSYARFLAAGLPRARLAIVPSYGHERPPDCSHRISNNLYNAPERIPDVTCLDSVAPVEFVTGVVPSRWVGNTFVRTGTRPWLAALPGAAALLLLVPAIGIPVRRIRARHRGQRDGGSLVRLALLLVAALGLAFVFGTAFAVIASLRRQVFIPLIGVPVEWGWLLALPWLLLVLTPVVAYLALSSRFRGTGEPSAVFRWTTLSGTALLAAFWFAMRT